MYVCRALCPYKPQAYSFGRRGGGEGVASILNIFFEDESRADLTPSSSRKDSMPLENII
jgi:hypothetical protein